MSERDRFDLTRGGDEDEDSSAHVSSLRRRGRPGPPPGARAQNRPHREFVARVRVPVTTAPAPSAAAALHETSRSQQSRRASLLRRNLVVVLAVLLTLAIGLAILHVHDGAARRSVVHRQRVALNRSLAAALTPGLASISAEIRRIAQDVPAVHHGARPRHTPLPSRHKMPTHQAASRTTSAATAPATAAADQSTVQPSSTPAAETRQPAAQSAGSQPSTASSSKTPVRVKASNPLGGIGSCVKGCS